MIAYSSSSLFESFVQKIQAKLKITLLECLPKTLGFQIERTTNSGVFMNQKVYIKKVLKRFGMSECNPADTPADHQFKLCRDDIVNAKSTMCSKATQEGEIGRGGSRCECYDKEQAKSEQESNGKIEITLLRAERMLAMDLYGYQT